jgi:hypothetical protein
MIQELFVWRFMQTDPNWGNFLYDVGSRTTTLIDFGAAREYPKSFVDRKSPLELSHKMGFLTGQENAIMMEAHIQSGFTLNALSGIFTRLGFVSRDGRGCRRPPGCLRTAVKSGIDYHLTWPRGETTVHGVVLDSKIVPVFCKVLQQGMPACEHGSLMA